MLFIFCYCKIVLLLFIFPPGGKVARLHLNGTAIQHQHMVYAGIQQIPVMRNQDKALFRCKIPFYNFPALIIQMIGRFIYQKEIIFSRKQNRQHNFGLLSKAQCFPWPIHDFCICLQLRKFCINSPQFKICLEFFYKFCRRKFPLFL